MEELLFRLLPARLVFMQEVGNALPCRIPIVLRLASQHLVYGLHVVEQIRAGIEKAGLVFYGHLVAQAQGLLHGHACVAEVIVVEELGALAVLKAAVLSHDFLNLLCGDVTALVAKTALVLFTPACGPQVAGVE